VLIEIAFAGICHTDVHHAREEYGTPTTRLRSVTGGIPETQEVVDFCADDAVRGHRSRSAKPVTSMTPSTG
jgi:D-arabinose 1-dehydrogenase-like Zn-dependent alcohol dehydrogenase